MKKNMMQIEPHPKRVLIKIALKDFKELFYKWVVREDGSKVQLFHTLEADEGYDQRFTQNVSAGVIVAVGTEMTNVYPSDIAIIDYMVTNNEDDLVGRVNGDRIAAVIGKTTYHQKDAKPSVNMRKAWVKGDYETISPLLGVVRNDKLVAFEPYVFLNFEQKRIMKVGLQGLKWEEDEKIVTREVLSAGENSGYKDGDKIIIKEEDLFFRELNGKKISVCFQKDILGKR